MTKLFDKNCLLKILEDLDKILAGWMLYKITCHVPSSTLMVSFWEPHSSFSFDPFLQKPRRFKNILLRMQFNQSSHGK